MSRGIMVQLRDILDDLEAYLDREFSRLWMTYEADMEALAFCFLRERLAKIGDGKWIIGCGHQVMEKHKWMPDLTIYRGDQPARFVKHPEQCIVAIIELKFRSSLKDDLEKLESIQTYLKHKDVLYWMVFADHFNESVHAGNFRSQCRREEAMKAWQRKNPKTRGCSVVKVGVDRSEFSKLERTNRELFNNYWWSRS